MAILDKFHIFRKAIALIQLFACIIVFTFSLILLIIGSITVGTANSTNDDFYQTTDYVSGGNLLIAAGVFGILIATIGALGAVPCLFDRQDNLNLWVGLIVLVVYILVLLGIFIFELSAGAWAYSKWDTISAYLQTELVEDVQINYGIGNDGYTSSVDALQQGFSCCGIGAPTDWEDSTWRTLSANNYSTNRIPSSCCSDQMPTTTVPSNMTVAPTSNTTNSTTNRRRRENIWRREIAGNISNTTAPVTMAPEIICRLGYSNSYTAGCWTTISDKLQSYTLSIAGVTIALAILQLLIIIVPILLLVIVVVELRRSKSLVIK